MKNNIHMEQNLFYQIIFGSIFFGLLLFAIITFLKEPKQILKDFFQTIYSGVKYSIANEILCILLFPLLIVLIIFKVFKKDEIFKNKNK